MHGSILNSEQQSVKSATWLAGVVPLWSEPDIGITALLASIILLLFLILFRLRQLQSALTYRSEALNKSENHIRLLGNKLPNVTIFQLTSSAEGHFSFNQLSQGCEQTIGLERTQLMQDAHLAFDHIYEADIPALREAYAQARERLVPTDLEIRVLDRAGHQKWLHISAVPHWENETIVWDGFVQDVSINKQVEDVLLEEKRNFQNLFETIDDFLLVCDMDGKLVHTNPSVKKRLGYSGKALKSMSIFELFPESAQDDAYRMIARMQTEHSTICNLPLQTRDGRIVQVETNVFQGSWKKQKAIFGVARDISGHQQTEDALRESQQMLQLIINTIPMTVFWKDSYSVYQGCNEKFIRDCGLERSDQVIGKNPADLFDEAVAADMIGRDKQVIATNRPIFNEQYSHMLPDGSMGWRNASTVPLRNGAGQAIGVLGVWHDVTEQTRGEERLRQTLEDMERFNHLMRGRERRTLELKGEVNRLLEELGRSAKYKTTSGGRP